MGKSSKFFRIVYFTDPNGGEYRFPFKTFTEKGLRVFLIDPRDMEQVPMFLGADYQVEGVGEADGGKVILTLRGLHKAEEGLKLVIKKGQAYQLGKSGGGNGGNGCCGDGSNSGNGESDEPLDCRCECSVPLWNRKRDYSPPSLVYGSDHYLYEAVKQSGPGTSVGPQDPVAETNDADVFSPWRAFDLPGNEVWHRSVYSPQGRFVALGSWTTEKTNVCAWSDDGVNWTKCNLPSSQIWRGLACNKDGIFIATAAGANAPMARSVDGINWTAVPVSSDNGFHGVTATPTGMFVAVGFGSSNKLSAWSNDGLTWTRTTMPRSAAWSQITCNSKGQCVAWGRNLDQSDSNAAAYSADGKIWQSSILPAVAEWSNFAVNHQDRFFIHTGGGNIGAYTDDGLNWHQTALPGHSANPVWSYSLVTDNGGAFVITGINEREKLHCIAYSYDAIDWTEAPPLLLPPSFSSYAGLGITRGPRGELLMLPFQPGGSGHILNDFKNPNPVEAAYWQRLDTNPVGTCLLRAGRKLPRNYIPLNGELLERAKYPQLWSLAEKSGLIVPDADWNANQSGYSFGDGASTFRIPQKAPQSNGWLECLKVK